jgi:hypothetical protein
LRDAGGFLLDLYRFGEQREILVRAKLEALIATDKEIRSLEAQLGVAGRVREIHQPGVGGKCPNCGTFHASAAKFCERCGAELGAAAPAVEQPPAIEEAPEAETVAEQPMPLPAEPDGEVTVVRQADEEPTAVQAPEPNGAVPAAEGDWPEPEHAESANGEAPTPETADPEGGDPGTGDIAAVGRTDGPRTRRSRARRRRGTDR